MATTINDLNPTTFGDVEDKVQELVDKSNTRPDAPDSGAYADVTSSPILGEEYYATDSALSCWIKYNGTEWQTLTGVSVDDLI